jgi:acetylornithine/N-succinyldiaminopimelate aminotransferase
MVRGEGSYLWDDSGRRYLDFVQGWAVNALGHCPPELRTALSAQSARLLSASPAFHNEPQLILAGRLTSLAGMQQAFFCNTGAEANEGATKIARKYGKRERGDAFEIITTHNAFHGRTLAMMAASGKPGWDALFAPTMPGFVKVPFGDANAVDQAITEKTAAVLVEPIQGEAGVVVPPDGYLRELRAIADRRGILLMLDEVQTGIGRTGTLFAFEAEAIVPDVLTLGKGLGGGVPIAAMLTTERAGTFAYGEQGGTFNGSALMTAAACAVLDAVAQPHFLARVRDAGEKLKRALTDTIKPFGLRGVRGRGLLLAAELDGPTAESVRNACFDRGLLVNAPRPETLRFMPSLRVTDAEIDEMAAILRDALRSAHESQRP